MSDYGKVPPKFKIGDYVYDTWSKRYGVVSALEYEDKKDKFGNPPEWHYSIDSIGWYYIPESDLELKE